jgi:hypothetical protein
MTQHPLVFNSIEETTKALADFDIMKLDLNMVRQMPLKMLAQWCVENKKVIRVGNNFQYDDDGNFTSKFRIIKYILPRGYA